MEEIFDILKRLENKAQAKIMPNEQQIITNVENLTEDEIKNIMLKTCGVPKRYINSCKSQISKKIWDIVSTSVTKNESFYIYGGTGVGKTHLSAAIIREKIISNMPKRIINKTTRYETYYMPEYPLLISIPDLLLNIKESYGDNVNTKEKEIIYNYKQKDCLLLDDLGVEKTTEWSLQTLYAIIDGRYKDMKQTIITSNLSLNNISDRVGDRIASRIAEMCRVIEIKGKDRRILKS